MVSSRMRALPEFFCHDDSSSKPHTLATDWGSHDFGRRIASLFDHRVAGVECLLAALAQAPKARRA